MADPNKHGPELILLRRRQGREPSWTSELSVRSDGTMLIRALFPGGATGWRKCGPKIRPFSRATSTLPQLVRSWVEDCNWKIASGSIKAVTDQWFQLCEEARR